MDSLTTKPNELALRELPGPEIESILRATLAASDYGILLTDPHKDILAVNRRLGELFNVDPVTAIDLGMVGLRERIYPEVVDPDTWMASTNKIYTDPYLEIEDVIELRRKGRLVLRRHTSPVFDSAGNLLGRLWTYQDITKERRQKEIHEILIRISSDFIPDPDASMRRIMKEIADFYGGSPTILSIRDDSKAPICSDDFLNFRMIENPPEQLIGLAGNPVGNAYCQFIFQSTSPLIIQDASLESAAGCLPAALGGYTRYLGAPVYGDSPEPLGTLCIMDQRSDEPLDDLDLQFMSLAAVRISAELARESYLEERVAEQRAQVERHREDLNAINIVLESMHASCELLWPGSDLDSLLQNQSLLLCGLLGYEGAAIAIRREGEAVYRGFAIDHCDHTPQVLTLTDDSLDRSEIDAITELTDPTHPLANSLRAASVAYAIRTEEGVGDVLIAYGGQVSALGDERNQILLKALSDQVSLLMGTHLLQSDLNRTSRKLGEAQDQLLQREKLAVVGTLAATTAHDIRNILASLSLLISPDVQPNEAGLAAIREQIGRFDVLAHRLLSYAKPRLVARQPVNILELLESVLAITSGQFRVHNVVLQSHLSEELPKVAGDPHEYQHLFVNLILNGIQAMAREGGTLTLSSEKVTGEPCMVEIRVSDTGAGVSPEIKERLFEPFASSRTDGFGLGLYSCRRIVEHHGGSISASRNESQGTAFTVRLPVFEARI